MFSVSIIIRFDVFNDTRFWHAPNHIPLLVNEGDFQNAKEALRDRLIVAVCSAPHATAQKTIVPDQLLTVLGTILASTIRMEIVFWGKPQPNRTMAGASHTNCCVIRRFRNGHRFLDSGINGISAGHYVASALSLPIKYTKSGVCPFSAWCRCSVL